jgi:parallel beta-helix repeat protein
MFNLKKNLLATLLVTVISLSILVSVNPVLANPGGAHTINVHKGDSIQAAIDAADPGAKVIVHKGTYIEGPIIINKALTLWGKDATIEYIKAHSSDRDGAINVLADNVEITGFTIHSSYGVGVGGLLSGIEVGWPGTVTFGCQIDNNVIVSPQWGLAGFGQQGVTISDNVITAQHPIWFTNAIDITIKNNVVTAGNILGSPAITQTAINSQISGIKLPGCNGAVIMNNQINSEKYGMLILAIGGPTPSNVEIAGNQIIAASDGIYADGNNFLVKNNQVFASLGTATNGIRIVGSNPTVEDNYVGSTGKGIYVSNCNNAIIKGNDVNAMATGIRVVSEALNDPTVYSNIKVIDNNVKSTLIGIFVGIALIADSTVQGNHITIINGESAAAEYPYGILMSGVNSKILDNSIEGNFRYGIRLNGNPLSKPPVISPVISEGNMIEANTIIGGIIAGDVGVYLDANTAANTIKLNAISNVDVPTVNLGINNIVS